MKQHFHLKLFLVLATLLTPVLAQAEFETSAELCRARAEKIDFTDTYYDGDMVAQHWTEEKKEELKRVLRSQCMLTLKELNKHYGDGSDKDKIAAFFQNYKMIKEAVPEETFDKIFPARDKSLTYANFIKSAVAFPALCGEEGQDLESCKREFAVMFAHWHQETTGLRIIIENSASEDATGMSPYLNAGSYFFNNHLDYYNPWDQNAGKDAVNKWKYFGRGPKQLSYNSNYGRFSWQLLGDDNRGMLFVEEPSAMLDDEFKEISFMSAFWYYMTPMSRKPSMHDMITGLWEPTDEETDRLNLKPGFGITINIINGALECGKGKDMPGGHNRIAYYRGGTLVDNEGHDTQTTVTGTLEYLGLEYDPGNDELSCSNMQPFTGKVNDAGQIIVKGVTSSAYPLYYNMNIYNENCLMSGSENVFTVYENTPLVLKKSAVCENGLDCCRKVGPKWRADPKWGKEDPIPDYWQAFPGKVDDFLEMMNN